MVSIVDYDVSTHKSLLSQVVDIHVAIVEQDGALMRFLPPFTDEKRARMLSWWEAMHDDAMQGLRDIILAVHDTSENGPNVDGTGATDLSSLKVAGIVILEKPEAETGPMRGNVEMLLVSPLYRRKGIARRLMVRLEQLGRQQGRTLLSLGTTAGSDAEYVYPRFGYIEIGRVPEYGIIPAGDGALADGVLFYKDLRKTKPL